MKTPSAMLIIPSAASRFWTNSLGHMTYISAGIGATSAALGVFASALFHRLAAGAVIVLTGSALFAISMFFGIRRGILIRLWTQYKLRLRVGRQHILRACYELLEARIQKDPKRYLNICGSNL